MLLYMSIGDPIIVGDPIILCVYMKADDPHTGIDTISCCRLSCDLRRPRRRRERCGDGDSVAEEDE